VAVELHRDARVGVAHDLLDGREVGARHDEERSRRVADVVEADRAHLPYGPELEPALRAPTNLVVWVLLDVSAAFSATPVLVARDDVRAAERST
jgi:hypothetical protein